MDWSKIYEGWRNKLFPPHYLKQQIEETSLLRTDICRGCEYDSINTEHSPLRPDEHCTVCLCTISAKTRCLSCECPLKSPKWKAVLTREQEEEIKNGKEIQNTEGSSGITPNSSGESVERGG